MKSKEDRNIKIQILWYLLGVALPSITLLARSPIYTRIYSPEVFGYYTLIYISFTYLSSLLFQWITSGSWRYYLKYESKGELPIYSSIIRSFYTISIAILLLVSTIWFFLTIDPFAQKLIIYGFIYSISQELSNTLLVPMRIREQAKKYNIIMAFRALLSFSALLVFTFYLGYGIEAFFITPAIFNVIIIATLLLSRKKTPLQNSKTKKLHLKRFFKYGASTLIFSSGILLLISSDRYLILFFSDHANVGIYNQTYNIAQISIAALFTAINAAFNPRLIGSLTKNPSESDSRLYQSFYLALYISIPFVVVFSFFSKEIATLLLGPEFRILWKYMPFIFFSAFLFGLSHYATLKLKFQNKLRILILSSLYAAFINVCLNLLLIPLFDYRVAAITTLVSYVFLIFYVFKCAGLMPFKFENILKHTFIIILSLLLMYVLHVVINKFLFNFNGNIVAAIIEGLCLVALFFLLTKRISPLKNDYLIND